MLNDDELDEMVDTIVTCTPWNHVELKEYLKGFLEECEDKPEDVSYNDPSPVPSNPLMCDSCKYNMNECDAHHEVVCEKMGATLAFGVAECISYEEN